ncbi:hypothetical protein GA0061105_1325 [Rhizobium aethiopicum]|uniref:SMODS and SLOG-associating 2TM effector domain-containing protein n=1 Tax=Rhizobium aethiopicum TaxID=1138170 RepID=A0A1C3YC80_9HYPH|nr:hypothetical protein [Rhizobium aethiopicum]SCB62097.1 hypothetical protein GA0061105_1325 [Rhizobium aethiopicum]
MTSDTFSTVDFKLQDYPLPEKIKSALSQVDSIRRNRFEYYQTLRRKSSKWVHGSRQFLAWAAALAFLFTAVGTGLRFVPPTPGTEHDKWLLLIALFLYSLVAALSLYERATDTVSAYFRHVTIILAMRDLWGKFQFEVFKEIPVALDGDVTATAAAGDRIVALCSAFLVDLDKLSNGEATEWRTEFLASLSELETAAKEGRASATTGLEEQLKRAEKAVQDAVAAAARIEATLKPSHINLTLTGNFDGEAVIFIDEAEVARSPGARIGLENVKAGPRKLVARALKDGKSLEVSQIVDVQPGVQSVTLAF